MGAPEGRWVWAGEERSPWDSVARRLHQRPQHEQSRGFVGRHPYPVQHQAAKAGAEEHRITRPGSQRCGEGEEEGVGVRVAKL